MVTSKIVLAKFIRVKPMEFIVKSKWICEKDSEFKVYSQDRFISNSRKRYWKKIASSKRIKCIRIAYYEWTFSFSSSLSVSQINYDFTLNSISFSQIQYKFTRKIYSWWNFRSTIFFANSLWSHYLFREFTIDSRLHYGSTIFSANPPWIHYQFRKSTMVQLSLSRIHNSITIRWLIH